MSAIYGVIKRESIDLVHKNGLVKPNEYEAIRDATIAIELFLRAEYLSNQTDRFINVLSGYDLIEEYYLKTTGSFNLKESIIYLAYNEPEKLLLSLDDMQVIILSDVAWKKAILVRDLGDINKSEHVSGDILGDKETIRALEYLSKHKKGLWDLLSRLEAI